MGPLRCAGEERGKGVPSVSPIVASSIASPKEITRWVDELGHDVFSIRQAAAAQLLAAGMSAREPLLGIVDGPDPERRAAARRLIALIDQSEFHRRLEAFAGDTDGRQRLTLPGWEQYQKLIGNDAAARALFVDMHRHESPLMAAAFGSSRQPVAELLESRLGRIVQWQNIGGVRGTLPPLGSAAAIVFLGSVVEVDASDESTRLIEMLIQRPPFLEALRSANRQDAARRLAIAWLLNCPNKNEGILLQRLNFISTIGVVEGLPLPLAVVAGEGPFKRTQASTRALAALVIGQLGGPEHIARVEPLLSDTANCNGLQLMPGQPSVQVRDVALVVLLQLTGQRPSDYGYTKAIPQPPKSFQLMTLGREKDEQRVEAIAKWRQWRAEHKEAAPADGKPK